MNPSLKHVFSKLEKRKSILLGRLDAIDEYFLSKVPDPESWSVVQVLRHLEISESMALQYIQKKSKAGVLMPPVSSIDRYKLKFVNGILRSGIKYKAPSTLPNPEATINYHDVCVVWYNTRKSLEDFLEDYPEQYLGKAVFKHPIAGRTDLRSMLLFLEAHLRHHEVQIKKILKKVKVND